MSLANLLTGDACSVGALYSHPMVEAVLGGSLHPGGIALTLDMCKALGPDDHLLDVGCGKGTSARAVAETTGCRVTGVDVSAASIAAARAQTNNGRISFQHLPTASLADLGGPFDAILSECVLCLQGDPAASLADYARLLRPGGQLLLSDVCVEGPAESFRSAAGFVACLGGALPFHVLQAEVEKHFTIGLARQDMSLVEAVRDRIRDRVDVDAAIDALGDQVPGLRRLVAESEAALEAGHLSYCVILGRREAI